MWEMAWDGREKKREVPSDGLVGGGKGGFAKISQRLFSHKTLGGERCVRRVSESTCVHICVVGRRGCVR